jgi:hypothetical protein
VIRWILTIFNLYRVLPYPGELKLKTITEPCKGPVRDKGYQAFMDSFWSLLPQVPFTWEWDPFKLSSKGAITYRKGNSTSGFLYALLALRRDRALWASVEWFFTKSPRASDSMRVVMKNLWKDLVFLSDLIIQTPAVRTRLSLGRLAYKEEPGKVRVFAMVDCVTQWLLNPLHKALFKVLRGIAEDGTFNQEAAVALVQKKLRERKSQYVASLDLSAATDRLPLFLQVQLLNKWVPMLGTHWGNLLVNRPYDLPNNEISKKFGAFGTVRYAVGQPMGALSSWAMLALTHHFIVQYAAFKVYRHKRWFTDYVILGDDLLVLDPKVAKMYLKVMADLGVEVGLAKSLVSTLGYGEFAKKFFNSTDIVSGLSLKEFSSLKDSWANILNMLSRFDISLTSFRRWLGEGSFAAGHQVEWDRFGHRLIISWIHSLSSVKDSYDFRDWLADLRFGMPILHRHPTRRPNGNPEYYLTYWAQGIGREWAKWIRITMSSWRQLDPSLKSSNLVRHMIAHHLSVPSTLEVYRIRQFFDYLIPSFKKRKPNAMELLAPQYVEFLNKVESCLQSLIDRTPLYDEVVWGRRQSTVDDFERFLTVSQTELSHGDAWSIYKVLSDSPKGWITPEALENYSDLSFVFDSVEPSSFKLPRTVKDIGLALWLKELVFNSHKVRYSLPRLGEFENKDLLKAINRETKVVQDPSDQSAEILRRLDLWNWGRFGPPI